MQPLRGMATACSLLQGHGQTPGARHRVRLCRVRHQHVPLRHIGRHPLPSPPAGGGAVPGTPPRVAGVLVPLRAPVRQSPPRSPIGLRTRCRPAGSAPIHNGVYQHLLKGAAVRLNHTARHACPALRAWQRG